MSGELCSPKTCLIKIIYEWQLIWKYFSMINSSLCCYLYSEPEKLSFFKIAFLNILLLVTISSSLRILRQVKLWQYLKILNIFHQLVFIVPVYIFEKMYLTTKSTFWYASFSNCLWLQMSLTRHKISLNIFYSAQHILFLGKWLVLGKLFFLVWYLQFSYTLSSCYVFWH